MNLQEKPNGESDDKNYFYSDKCAIFAWIGNNLESHDTNNAYPFRLNFSSVWPN